jgi:hypothetical protein
MTDQLRPGPLGHPPPARGLLVDPHQVLPLVAEDGFGIQGVDRAGVARPVGSRRRGSSTGHSPVRSRMARSHAHCRGIREGWTDTQ